MVGMFLVLLILFCLLLALDYYLGSKKARSLSSPRDYPIRNGRVDLYVNGNKLFKKFFEDLEQATQTIYTLFYIVKDDEISQKFLDILAEKSRQGVKVYLLMDWMGSRKVKKILKRLDGTDVKVGFSRKPRFPYLFFHLQRRNHRKITVIDHKVAYLGGFNVAKEYLGYKSKLSPWRDYHLRIAGGSSLDLENEFSIDWNQENSVPLILGNRDVPVSQGHTAHRITPSEVGHLEPKVKTLIDQARSSIIIGTPYFIPTPPIFKSLLEALKRGVDVSIIVPDQADHALVKEAAYPYFRKMLRHGSCHIYQYSNGFYHAKILMIDKEFCDIGTANFDKRSFLLNDECNCFIYDQRFIERALEVIRADIEASKRLTLQELNNMGIGTRLKEKLASSVSTFL
ncbi:MAG TPA: phospholipase D-like domain-containing protein [Chondromyces sp.]|nr:phospholipase D-like domain-containing protein [Chondromyces sp.]